MGPPGLEGAGQVSLDGGPDPLGHVAGTRGGEGLEAKDVAGHSEAGELRDRNSRSAGRSGWRSSQRSQRATPTTCSRRTSRRCTRSIPGYSGACSRARSSYWRRRLWRCGPQTHAASSPKRTMGRLSRTGRKRPNWSSRREPPRPLTAHATGHGRAVAPVIGAGERRRAARSPSKLRSSSIQPVRSSKSLAHADPCWVDCVRGTGPLVRAWS
jgi:hypothetical protein